jgi:hypothetical protein
MTIADFLYQAGFWQWVGILSLAAILVDAIRGAAKFRFWGNTVINEINNVSKEEKQ